MRLNTLYPEDERVKTFMLPVTGAVRLAGPEIDIVRSPEFQRLAGIRQLGTSYVVFRGANHTRFEHSLGSLAQAERMLLAIENNAVTPHDIPPEARRLARLGALLHDLPHVPFGHTLEDEFHLLERHDTNKHRWRTLLLEGSIAQILRRSIGESEFDELVRVLRAKTDRQFGRLRYPYVGDIIGNTVCADLLDYVPRDLAACGMPVTIGDHFLDYLTLTPPDAEGLHRSRVALNLDKRGMPRPDVESEVVDLLSRRYELAERVYFHHAKNSASVMIARAVLDAGFAGGKKARRVSDPNFLGLSDEGLLLALREPAAADALGLHRTPEADAAGIQRASAMASAVSQRRLYKIAYLAVHDDVVNRVDTICDRYGKEPLERRGLEDWLGGLADLEVGHALVHIPAASMMEKRADVRVCTQAGDIVTLSQWDASHSRRLQALNEAHRRLWRVTVYVHPDAAKEQVRLLTAAAAAQFGAPSRYRPTASATVSYLREVFDREGQTEGWDVRDWNSIVDTSEGVAALSFADSYQEIAAGLRTRVQLAREIGAEAGIVPPSTGV